MFEWISIPHFAWKYESVSREKRVMLVCPSGTEAEMISRSILGLLSNKRND